MGRLQRRTPDEQPHLLKSDAALPENHPVVRFLYTEGHYKETTVEENSLKRYIRKAEKPTTSKQWRRHGWMFYGISAVFAASIVWWQLAPEKTLTVEKIYSAIFDIQIPLALLGMGLLCMQKGTEDEKMANLARHAYFVGACFIAVVALWVGQILPAIGTGHVWTSAKEIAAIWDILGLGLCGFALKGTIEDLYKAWLAPEETPVKMSATVLSLEKGRWGFFKKEDDQLFLSPKIPEVVNPLPCKASALDARIREGVRVSVTVRKSKWFGVMAEIYVEEAEA